MHATKSKRMILGAFALAMGFAGCASAGGGSGTGGSSSPNRIVAADLAGLEQYDVYQAIQRLRPRWLQTRGTDNPEIYVDGARRGGGMDELRSMRSADVQQMEFMSATDASTRFGTGHTGGAILITTKR